MIIFEKLKVRNILSWGDQETVLDFQSHHLTLVTGKSGSGKSSLICDSLFFVLFGKTYKNINKPSLVNSVNGNNCIVEVTFSTSKSMKYKVVRGIKPAQFEIYENNRLIEQTAENKDYQFHLENNILRMNDKIFRQIVFVGSSNYVPFLKLPLSLRRDIIENILNIKIYSIMLVKLKDKISGTENVIRQIQIKINQLKAQLDIQEKIQNTMQIDIDNEISIIKSEIEILEDKKTNLEQAQTNLQKKIKNTLQSTNSKHTLEKSTEQQKKNIYHFSLQKEKLEKDILFFTKNINDTIQCPTCEQLINSEFKYTVKLTKEQEIQELSDKLISEHHAYNLLNEKLKKCNELEKLQSDIIIKLKEVNRTISNKTASIVKLLNQEKINNIIDTSLQEKYDTVVTEKNSQMKLLDSYELILPLLKDTGVKTVVIKQYIIRMNEMLNEFLNLLNLPILFNINDEFKEEIKSRYRDHFIYENFSDGEKSRIDLAIMLLLREMSKLKNAIDTNILVLDEADSALDEESRKAFFNLYKTLLVDKNIFIISHHQQEEMMDKYDQIIQIEKIGNFSTMLNLN